MTLYIQETNTIGVGHQRVSEVEQLTSFEDTVHSQTSRTIFNSLPVAGKRLGLLWQKNALE